MKPTRACPVFDAKRKIFESERLANCWHASFANIRLHFFFFARDDCARDIGETGDGISRRMRGRAIHSAGIYCHARSFLRGNIYDTANLSRWLRRKRYLAVSRRDDAQADVDDGRIRGHVDGGATKGNVELCAIRSGKKMLIDDKLTVARKRECMTPQ